MRDYVSEPVLIFSRSDSHIPQGFERSSVKKSRAIELKSNFSTPFQV